MKNRKCDQIYIIYNNKINIDKYSKPIHLNKRAIQGDILALFCLIFI
jgi:hypothetical protein